MTTCWFHGNSNASKPKSSLRKLYECDCEHWAVYPVDSTSCWVCVRVRGCQYFMMWLTLSTEHEQTPTDLTVYQWNIALPFPSSLSPSTIARSALHSFTVSPLLSVSSHPSLVQFFISGLILLTSSQLTSDDTSPSFSVVLCWPVNLSCPLPPSLSLSWNQLPRHVVSTCHSSHHPHQRVHSRGLEKRRLQFFGFFLLVWLTDTDFCWQLL